MKDELIGFITTEKNSIRPTVSWILTLGHPREKSSLERNSLLIILTAF